MDSLCHLPTTALTLTIAALLSLAGFAAFYLLARRDEHAARRDEPTPEPPSWTNNHRPRRRQPRHRGPHTSVTHHHTGARSQ